MAPEVILQSGYNEKADIWSLGYSPVNFVSIFPTTILNLRFLDHRITAIELATGNPPHHTIHPMRALFLIPKSEPPTLEGSFSVPFKEFVQACLNKDAKQRLSTKDLLKQRFIKSSKRTSALAELVQKHQRLKEAKKVSLSAESTEKPSHTRLQSPLHHPNDSELNNDDLNEGWDFGTVRGTLPPAHPPPPAPPQPVKTRAMLPIAVADLDSVTLTEKKARGMHSDRQLSNMNALPPPNCDLPAPPPPPVMNIMGNVKSQPERKVQGSGAPAFKAVSPNAIMQSPFLSILQTSMGKALGNSKVSPKTSNAFVSTPELNNSGNSQTYKAPNPKATAQSSPPRPSKPKDPAPPIPTSKSTQNQWTLVLQSYIERACTAEGQSSLHAIIKAFEIMEKYEGKNFTVAVIDSLSTSPARDPSPLKHIIGVNQPVKSISEGKLHI
jgi:serine/threonine protein kinase